MKAVRSRCGLTFLALLFAAGWATTAPAAQDPFLLLSPPSFVSNKIQFTITGEAEVGYVVEASADSVTWTAVATNVDTNITRVVSLTPSTNAVFYRAWRKDLPVFAGALVAKEGIDFMGNGVHVDSFDSGDSRYNTYGVYDPAKRKDGGGVASINGGINAGNAGINGKLRTGIRGDFAFGANGYAGPLDWFGPGVYSPEYFRKDFRFVLPDVGPPYTNGLPPVPQLVGTNKWVLGSAEYLVPGNFTMNNQVMLVTGKARLYVKGDFGMLGNAEIKIVSGAGLQLYVEGANAMLTQVNALDPYANAPVFQYYGLPGNTNLWWGGNVSFVGTIYAPSAALTLGGGGNTVRDFQGACAASTILVNSHIYIHFDEDLQKGGPQR